MPQHEDGMITCCNCVVIATDSATLLDLIDAVSNNPAGEYYPTNIIGIALEGAFNLKESRYIRAEAYASGELKYGPIALIDEKMPVVVVDRRDALFDKTESSMQEATARGGKVILITDQAGAKAASDGVWQTIEMPDIDFDPTPVLYALPVQFLADHTAVTKSTDVDQPATWRSL